MGSLFAGIGGFDVGFENAGYRTPWQVELNPVNRAVLADRFPHARQFEEVRECGPHRLCAVDVITAGFPCQDISCRLPRQQPRHSRPAGRTQRIEGNRHLSLERFTVH